MEQKTRILLSNSGLCRKYSGYLYIIECIKIISNDPPILDRLCKALYVDVAKTFHVSSRCVERNIRYAIAFLYKNGSFEIYPWPLILQGHEIPPSNKTFLCLLYDYLMQNIA